MSLTEMKAFAGRLTLPSEIKATGAKGSGEFEGYASTRKLDSDRDIVQPGAFKRTIDHNPDGWALLWFHDPTKPIGDFKALGEDDKGLVIAGTVDVDTQLGHDTYSGMTKGYIDRFSIGYVAKRARWDTQAKARLLDEVALRETSAITRNFAANDEALLTSLKSASATIHQWVNTDGYGGTTLDVYTGTQVVQELVEELRALFASGILGDAPAMIADSSKDSGGPRIAHPSGDAGGSALATLLRDTTKSLTQAMTSPTEAKAAVELRRVFATLRD